jgi:hypothetical protein
MSKVQELLKEILKEHNISSKKSCSCGCNTCDDKKNKTSLTEIKSPISENLKFHLDKGIQISENVFRIGSKSYLGLFNEARLLNDWGYIQLSESDKHLIEITDIGKFGIYEGQKVPLDMPMIEFINEAEYQGKNVQLGKPKRGGSKKFYVYVMNPKTKKVKKVSFGAAGGGQNLRVKFRDPKARRAFADRQNCDKKTDRTTPGYWSCNLPRYVKALGLGSNMNSFW